MIDDSCPLVTVIIPAYNAACYLRSCLPSLQASDYPNLEILVMDDGSTDGTAAVAGEYGVRVVGTGRRGGGPAIGRNRGALQASGEYLVFIDADVVVQPNTISELVAPLADERISAVFGSYDERPRDPSFVSQFRNLLHHYVHQTAREEASTFWAGCGAIRRETFLDVGGFDTNYGRSSIEDIELGVRLINGGHRIVLKKQAQVSHLKKWTAWSMFASDLRDRGIPWTRLLLSGPSIPNDLNLKHSQRLSVLFTLMFGLLISIAGWTWVSGSVVPPSAATWTLLSLFPLALIASINWRFYHFLGRLHGWWFATASLPLHVLHYFTCGLAFCVGSLLHAFDNLRQLSPAPPAIEFGFPSARHELQHEERALKAEPLKVTQDYSR